MSISKQVKELRDCVHRWQSFENISSSEPFKLISEAADTIESLSAKLKEANSERSEESRETEKRLIEEMTEEIERLRGRETDLTEWARDYLENMERPAEDCGGWIPCKVKLPEVGQEVILQDYYGNREIGRFGYNEDYQEGFYIVDWFSTANNYLAWHESIEPYHEP